ncbi:dTDP-4-dehydrorhamnose reductase [Salirhabdus salicampi]|uniref:dTDP-4-dehydrorhamnose reductase n=1 Tax=Salirhabdus salicampi TaxID=476102 RepID=UPI0020C5959E|nr:dTDP-4-dehydrorhamnose reductase [Salirhabdus salicampi]MCP8617497.1 dTDP-4-dehydrorhamnose reductase [Salirhabdus salicampi]
MSKIVVTGAAGQLGSDVVQQLRKIDEYEVYGFTRQELDITNDEEVFNTFRSIRPDAVIHCAAYTKVDHAEEDPDTAYLVNAIGSRNIAAASEKVKAKLVYVSTDYVFNGESEKPYHEFEETSPLGVYGKSKLAGETFVRNLHSQFFIVRTSWVFGVNGQNFVKTMMELAKKMDELKVVEDQVGSPTYTQDLARNIIEMVQTEKYGTYHVSNSGQCSWFEFASEIFNQIGSDIKVNPCTTEEFPRPAPRPKNSVFDHMALRLNQFAEMPHWRDALTRFLQELQEKQQSKEE